MANNISPTNTTNSTLPSTEAKINRVAEPQYMSKFTNPNTKYTAQSSTTALSNTQSSTSKQTITSPAVVPTKQMSSFAQSAYETAETDFIMPPAPQTIDLSKFKGSKFIILDGLISEVNTNYEDVAGTFQWSYLQNQEDRCADFLRDDCVDTRAFLIVSGSLGKKVISDIHQLPQLYCVYVYCGDVDSHRKWAKNYSKVRTVCNDDRTHLLPQLAVDVAQTNIDWGNALLAAGNKAEAKSKFEKALENLNKYAVRPDPAMISRVTSKIHECK